MQIVNNLLLLFQKRVYRVWFYIDFWAMNYERLQYIHQENGVTVLPIKVWMRLEIYEKIGEEDNQRIWKFKWLVLKVHKPKNADGTFTIRGQAARMTLEKIYPLSFPNFEKVLLLDEHSVRRSKLYYMRDKVGKKAKLKSNLTAERRNLDLVGMIQDNDVSVSHEVEQEIS